MEKLLVKLALLYHDYKEIILAELGRLIAHQISMEVTWKKLIQTERKFE
jgi:hypothetical protein